MKKALLILSLSVLLICQASFTAYHFFYLSIGYEELIIREPRQWLAILEFAIVCGIVAFGIFGFLVSVCLIRKVVTKRKKQEKT